MNPKPEDGLIRRFNHPNPAECAYCSSIGNLTEEDFLPMWLDGVLTPKPKATALRRSTGYMEDGAPYEIYKKRQGSARRRSRVKAVCRQCNGGWMSRLQQRTKPLLTDLILDRAAVLDVHARNLLASWICMTTMSAEFSQRSEICIPRRQRLEFAQRKAFALEPHAPPRDWYIGIARQQSKRWETKYWHCSVRIGSPTDTEYDRWGPPNYHSSTFGLGRLLMHVHGTTSPVKTESPREIRDFCSRLGMVPLWPLEEDIDWEKLPVLADETVEGIAHWQDILCGARAAQANSKRDRRE